jgi:uncharacterized protein (DUF58 family)
MNKSLNTLIQINEEILTPEAFLNLSDKEKSNISHTEIVAPRGGRHDFGKIKVHYRNPKYRPIK